MTKRICFDMDGTIADLYGVKNWLNYLQTNDTYPYEKATPLLDFTILNTILRQLQKQGWIITIITWYGKNANQEYKVKTRKAKLHWLEKNNFVFNEFHGIQYGTTKANTVRKNTSYAVLVDDDNRVRKGWHLGATINPTTENVVEKLKNLLTK